MHNFFKGIEKTIERKDGEIVITIKGDKEKLDVIEKKLKALDDLCDCDCKCC